MKIISKQKPNYVIRFDSGEKWPEALLAFLKKANIKSGWFFGFGAFKNPELAYYDHARDKYLKRKFRGIYEALSLVGNISLTKKGIIAHNHIVLGDKNYKTIGGHLVRAEVGATLEVFFTSLPLMRRELDSSGFGILV